MTSHASEQGLRGGWALDIEHVCKITGKTWNCLEEVDRAWRRRMVYRDRPKLLIVSPSCTLFSQLQNPSPNGLPEKRCPEAWNQAKLMVEFAVELCLMQKRAGRAFVFEHPRTATSWEVVQKLKQLLEDPEVEEAVLDMCCYDMKVANDRGEPGLVRKTTRLLTNSLEIASATARRCCGGHSHVNLVSGRAKHAAIYPPKFCKALLDGFFFWNQRQLGGVV